MSAAKSSLIFAQLMITEKEVHFLYETDFQLEWISSELHDRPITDT